MENNISPLSQYSGTDLIDVLNSAIIREGQKDSHKYYYIDFIFENGFSKRIFLKNEDAFAIKDLLS